MKLGWPSSPAQRLNCTACRCNDTQHCQQIACHACNAQQVPDMSTDMLHVPTHPAATPILQTVPQPASTEVTANSPSTAAGTQLTQASSTFMAIVQDSLAGLFGALKTAFANADAAAAAAAADADAGGDATVHVAGMW